MSLVNNISGANGLHMGTESPIGGVGQCMGGWGLGSGGAAGQVTMEVTAVSAPLKPACGLTVHLPGGTSPGWSWLTHRRGRDFESRGEKTWKIGPQGGCFQRPTV